MGIQLRGLADVEGQLRGAVRRADEDVVWVAEDMAVVLTRAVKAALGRADHLPGTPTPSPPGTPPARISGQLQASVNTTGRMSWPGRASVRVAPTAPYARIQELGGWAGRGHATHLPARPYLRPALALARDDIRAAAVRGFRDVVENR